MALHQQALDLRGRHRRAEAEIAARRSLALFERHAGPDDPDVANVANLLAALRADDDDLGEAEALGRRAVALMAALPAGDEDIDRLRVQSVRLLATILRRQGRYDESRHLFDEALPLARDAFGPGDSDTVATENELAILCKYTGRFDEAEALYRHVLAVIEADSAVAAAIYHNLAGLAHSRGRYADGEPWARRSVEVHTATLGPDHPDTVADSAQLGSLLDALGRSDEAEALFRDAIARFERLLGPDHYEVAVNAANLAVLLAREGGTRAAEAEALYRRAVEIKTRVLGPHNAEVGTVTNNLGVLLAELGRVSEAEDLFARALPVLGATLGTEDETTRACATNLDELRRRRS